jgi:phosphatidylserine/phosphatidylglycerophosphate/cardiolipin synthase-like enzyme
MASSAERRRLEQRAAERLLEDERLRAGLTDEQAQTLLNWGLAQLSAQVAALDEPTPEKVDEIARRIRKAMAGINSLVRERGGPTARGGGGELAAQLRELIAPAQLEAEVERLASQAHALSADQLLVRLMGLVSQAWDPQTRRKAKDKSPRGPSKTARVVLALIILAILCGLCVLTIVLVRRRPPQPTPTVALASPTFTVAPTHTRQVLQPTPTVVIAAGERWYRVFFTAPKYPDKAAERQGSLDEELTAFINGARRTVDVAIYQLDLPNVTQALLEAKKRGCKVRVVTDIDILEDPKENPAFKKLQAAKITVVAGNPNAIMHNKFVVVDEEAVWTGSWNFTENDTYRYNNNALLIRSPELARNYTVVFEKMWGDKKFGRQRKAGGTTPILEIAGARVENYFAPEDQVASKIVARLKKAQKSIVFMAFSFTDDDIGEAVLSRAKAGVKVRGVFERTGSETEYSEYGRMKRAKLDVLQDGNPYLMHHKVFIVDETTVIVGSFNFSKNAEEENDENLLIIDDAALAQAFLAEFERVYAQAESR